MAKDRKSWRHFSIRALLFLTFTAAVFFGGYRLGFHVGRDAYFDPLVDLIEITINPSPFEEYVEGPGSIEVYDATIPSPVMSDACGSGSSDAPVVGDSLDDIDANPFEEGEPIQ